MMAELLCQVAGLAAGTAGIFGIVGAVAGCPVALDSKVRPGGIVEVASGVFPSGMVERVA